MITMKIELLKQRFWTNFMDSGRIQVEISESIEIEMAVIYLDGVGLDFVDPMMTTRNAIGVV